MQEEIAPQDKIFGSLCEQSDEMSEQKNLELSNKTGWNLTLMDFLVCYMNLMRQSSPGTDWFYQSLQICPNIWINLRHKLQRKDHTTLLCTPLLLMINSTYLLCAQHMHTQDISDFNLLIFGPGGFSIAAFFHRALAQSCATLFSDRCQVEVQQ